VIEPSPAGLDIEQLIRRIREEATRRQPETNDPNALDAPDATPRQWLYTLEELLRQDDVEFLTHAYRCLLRREPDHEGLQDHLARLHNGESSQIDALRELRFSPEGDRAGVTVQGLAPPAGRWTLTPLSLEPEALPIRDRYTLGELLQYRGTAFVRNAYRALLHREPDSSGLAHHLEKLCGGVTRLDLILGLWLGSEGRAIAVELTGWSDFASVSPGSAP